MKSAVNCDKTCELQNYVNHLGLERILHPIIFDGVGRVERQFYLDHQKGLKTGLSWSSLPTELKHIIMWRKRNQQGFPK